MLSNWTGLKLHPDFAGDSDDEEEEEVQNRREPVGGAQRCSIRKWKKGNYTLLHDADSNERASVDLFLHIFPNQKLGKRFTVNLHNFFWLDSTYVFDLEWDIARGGFVSYLTKGEDEELLTITPKANSLSLVFRDEDTLRFVKYVNSKSNKDYFYDIFACYYE